MLLNTRRFISLIRDKFRFRHRVLLRISHISFRQTRNNIQDFKILTNREREAVFLK